MEKRQWIFLVALFAASLLAVQYFFKPSPPRANSPVINASVLVATPREQEQRYLLENDYQQVVFSNLGGSISEINLSLRSAKNRDSVINPVGIDEKLLTASPLNARFPLLPTYVWNESTKSPLLKKEGQLGGYYPLLRRGSVIEQASSLRPELYACTLSRLDGALTSPFQVSSFSNQHITFVWKENGNRITKTYRLGQPPLAAPYLLQLQVETEGSMGPLWISTGIPEVEIVSGNAVPSLEYALNHNGSTEVEKLDLPKDQVIISSLYPRWISAGNGYFSFILDPRSEVGPGFRAQQIPSEQAPSRLQLLPAQAGDYPGYRLLLPLGSRPGKTDFAIYGGPLDTDTLAHVDSVVTQASHGDNPEFLELKTLHGFFAFISAPFANFMWWLMQVTFTLTHNWGVSLLVLTLALRIITWPLNQWSLKSMAKAKKLEPEMAQLQKQFAGQPQLLRAAQIDLYKAHGYNPLGALIGPLVIQMPFLAGLFELLRTAFPLRGASLIPGWIDNLAAPDVLFSWNFHIPLIGNSFHALPILLGVMTFWQFRSSSGDAQVKPGEPLTDQQRQKRTMSTIIPVVFTYLFYSAPSGFNLFWLFSTILGILQQRWVNRSMEQPSATSKVVPMNRQ